MKKRNYTKTKHWMPIMDTRGYKQFKDGGAIAILESDDGKFTVRIRGFDFTRDVDAGSLDDAKHIFKSIASVIP